MQLSSAQAQKIVLLSQGIHKEYQLGYGKQAVLNAIEKLGYIQVDTISVVERAHHHTLWNRVKRYDLDYLNQLQEQRTIFEYWSHAAAYLPMRDYRYSLPFKDKVKRGLTHWKFNDKKLTQWVLQRIEQEGPLQAKDFEHIKRGNHSGWWDWKPAKRALEQLYMQGDLMISKRRGFQKVYDLSERVLPDNIDTRTPTENEHLQYLILSYLTANGLGTPVEIGYLRKGLKPLIAKRCKEMLEDRQLLSVTVNNRPYYALPDTEQLLSTPLSRTRVKILSPFDNLLIQRKRTLELFGFDYQVECYVPAAKRKYGYFCLPLLWGQQFAGRMDAKIDRKEGTLHILNLHIETDKTAEFKQAFAPSLNAFLAFNRGDKILYS